MKVIKKDGTFEDFNADKIVNAVKKSAARVMIALSDNDFSLICSMVIQRIPKDVDALHVSDMHNIVEEVLEEFNPKIAKSYKDYRNYKKDFIHMMDEVYMKSQSIRFIGDKENANTDSTLVATKRCLIFNDLNKRLYRKFFMTQEELQACKDGYIYIHDQSARLDTMNCAFVMLVQSCQVVLKWGMFGITNQRPWTLHLMFLVTSSLQLHHSSMVVSQFLKLTRFLNLMQKSPTSNI